MKQSKWLIAQKVQNREGIDDTWLSRVEVGKNDRVRQEDEVATEGKVLVVTMANNETIQNSSKNL